MNAVNEDIDLGVLTFYFDHNYGHFVKGYGHLYLGAYQSAFE